MSSTDIESLLRDALHEEVAETAPELADLEERIQHGNCCCYRYDGYT